MPIALRRDLSVIPRCLYAYSHFGDESTLKRIAGTDLKEQGGGKGGRNLAYHRTSDAPSPSRRIHSLSPSRLMSSGNTLSHLPRNLCRQHSEGPLKRRESIVSPRNR